MNNGKPTLPLKPGFSDGMRTVVHGKNGNPPDEQFLANIGKVGWFVPPLENVATRRADKYGNEPLQTSTKNRKWNVMAFVFIDAKDNPYDKRKTLDKVPYLVAQLIQALKRYDTEIAKTYPERSKYQNVYHKFNKFTDLLFKDNKDEYTPLDYVLLDEDVATLLRLLCGDRTYISCAENIMLYHTALDERQAFTERENGYNSIPIVQLGYPIRSTTPTSTIVERINNTIEIIIQCDNNDDVEKIVKYLAEDVFDKLEEIPTREITNAISKLHEIITESDMTTKTTALEIVSQYMSQPANEKTIEHNIVSPNINKRKRTRSNASETDSDE